MIAFGPVPSRRLGRSLGINNISPKVCSYSCVYCQLGRTTKMRVERQPFYEPEEVLRAVRSRIARVSASGDRPQVLTFVSDGEPTLDIHLGREIELLRGLGLPIAVITNASLVWRRDVREDLMATDWVSLKLDAAEEGSWQHVNRPHRTLRLPSILEGALAFAESYTGKMTTETMLVAGCSDGEDDLRALARTLARLGPAVSYLSIATRPPSEEWVRAPEETTLNRAYQILSEQVERVEYLIGYEGDAFAHTGEIEQDLLSITAVHPMREDAVDALLARAGSGWAVVHRLLAEERLVEAQHEGYRFYLRRLNGPGNPIR